MIFEEQLRGSRLLSGQHTWSVSTTLLHLIISQAVEHSISKSFSNRTSSLLFLLLFLWKQYASTCNADESLLARFLLTHPGVDRGHSMEPDLLQFLERCLYRRPCPRCRSHGIQVDSDHKMSFIPLLTPRDARYTAVWRVT
jgi:hypothetical protein